MLGRAKNMPIERGDFHESGNRSLRIKEATGRRHSFADILATGARAIRRLSHHILDPLMLTEETRRRSSLAHITEFLNKSIQTEVETDEEVENEYHPLHVLHLRKHKILAEIESYNAGLEETPSPTEEWEIMELCQAIAKVAVCRCLTLPEDNDNKQPNEESSLYIKSTFFFLEEILTHFIKEKINYQSTALMISGQLKYLGEISQLVLPHLRKLENNIDANVQDEEHIITSATLEFELLIDESFDEAESSSRFWAKVGFSGSVISTGIVSYIFFNINENIKCMSIWEDNSDPCNPCIPTRESLLERQQKLIWAMAPTVLAAALALFGKSNLRKSANQEEARMRLKTALIIFEKDLCTALCSTETEKSHDLSANPEKSEKICAEPTLPRLSEKLEPEESEAVTTKLGETQDISPPLQLSDIELCSQFTNSTLRDREVQQVIL